MIRFDKHTYTEFCHKQAAVLPLFLQAWWLDAVCEPGSWRAGCILNGQNRVVGIWPVYTRRKYGFPCHDLPAYTPFFGPWVGPGLPAPGLSLETLIPILPRALYHLVHCFPSPFETADWLKNGFIPQPHGTYRLPRAEPADQLFRRFNSSTKNEIRQASRNLTIEKQGVSEAFSALYQNFLREKGLYTPHLMRAMEAFVSACAARGQGQVLLAFDGQHRLQAGVVVVWDQQTTYSMITAANPDGRRAHAVRLLLWQAIQDAVQRGHIFDFEGGNIPGIGRFFASFGAEKVPYLRARRYSNALVRAAFHWFKGRG